MKILPINNSTYSKGSIKRNKVSSLPSFQGVRIASQTKKAAIENLGDLANLFLNNLKTSKSKRRYASINEEETLKNFITLQKNDPNVAKLVLESGRRLSETTCEAFNFGRVLKGKELQAFETLINAKGGVPERHLLITTWLTRYFTNSPQEEELDAIIESTPKIVRIFKNCPTFEERKVNDYTLVAMALLLKNPDGFSEEEMKRYVHANLGFDEEHLQDWISGDKEARDGILTLLENNPYKEVKEFMEDAYLLYESPIIPSKNLLNKLKLLNEEPLLSGVRGLLEENCLAEDLEKNFKNFIELPLLTQSTISSKLLGNLIINFEKYKLEGNILNSELSSDDYIKLAKLLPQKYFLSYLSETDELCNIPKITDSVEKQINNNIKHIEELDLFDDTPANTILRMIFCPNFEENLPLLRNLIIGGSKNIINELKLKCQNFNPEFVVTARLFLDIKENLCTLATLPNFTEKGITENLFHIAKMQALAMKHPERFMNYNKDEVDEFKIETLQDISKYILTSAEQYTDKEIFIPEELAEPFYELFGVFTEELLTLYIALANTDAEYMNMIFSKRVAVANEEYKNIANWQYKTGEIISHVLRECRTLDSQNIPIKLSGKQKEFIVQNFPMTTNESFVAKLREIIKQNQTPLKDSTFLLNYDSLVDDYNSEILKGLGIIANKQGLKQWDKEFLPLILNRIKNDKGELKLAFELLSSGEFKKYIHNPFTPHGESNLKTKKEFEALNLDYQTWLDGVPARTFKIGDNTYSIGLLDKSEPNGLFMGNYTSCCTGIDRKFGESTPTYLLNTTFNIIVIKDSDGKIAGMTRVFINNNHNRPEFIIDNTEFDTKLLNTPHQILETPILDYIKDFTKALNPKGLPVFISSEIYNIEPCTENLTDKFIKPVGEITKKLLYINCVHERTDTTRAHRVQVYPLDI